MQIRVQSFWISDNLLWLRLFEFHTLEIRRGNLERVENEPGSIGIHSAAHDQFGHLPKSELDGIGILKRRQNNLGG